MNFGGGGQVKKIRKHQQTSQNIRKHHETSKFEDHPRPDRIKKYQKGSENIKYAVAKTFPHPVEGCRMYSNGKNIYFV